MPGAVSLVRHWTKLPPEEVVNAPSLEILNASWDGALGNVIYWKVSLPIAGDWNETVFKVSSKPDHSMMLS